MVCPCCVKYESLINSNHKRQFAHNYSTRLRPVTPGVTVICVSPGYTCHRTYIPRETRSREHISLKLHFLSVTVIYVSLRYVFPPEKRLWDYTGVTAVNTERCMSSG